MSSSYMTFGASNNLGFFFQITFEEGSLTGTAQFDSFSVAA